MYINPEIFNIFYAFYSALVPEIFQSQGNFTLEIFIDIIP